MVPLLRSFHSGISQRSKEQWNNRPHELRYDPTIWGSSRPLDECYSLMMISLDHLYNDWLLQRVIVQRLHGDSRELLRLSDKMLSDGLAAVTQGGGDIGWNYIDLPWSVGIEAPLLSTCDMTTYEACNSLFSQQFHPFIPQL